MSNEKGGGGKEEEGGTDFVLRERTNARGKEGNNNEENSYSILSETTFSIEEPYRV